MCCFPLYQNRFTAYLIAYSMEYILLRSSNYSSSGKMHKILMLGLVVMTTVTIMPVCHLRSRLSPSLGKLFHSTLAETNFLYFCPMGKL